MFLCVALEILLDACDDDMVCAVCLRLLMSMRHHRQRFFGEVYTTKAKSVLSEIVSGRYEFSNQQQVRVFGPVGAGLQYLTYCIFSRSNQQQSAIGAFGHVTVIFLGSYATAVSARKLLRYVAKVFKVDFAVRRR